MTETLDSGKLSVDSEPASPAAERRPVLAIRSHEAALEGLRQALDGQARMLVLIGEPRAGKSTVIHRLADELRDAYTPIYCPAAGLDFEQILDFVLTDPRLADPATQRTRDVVTLVERLTRGAARPVALLIDDADRARSNALDQILRLASGAERKRERLCFVLGGRPALQDRLRRAREAHPCVARATFARLTRLRQAEAESLVERLASSSDPASIAPTAARRLIAIAEGLPGAIVKLHGAAAAAARRRGNQTIGLEDVEDAAHVPRTPRTPPSPTARTEPGRDATDPAPARRLTAARPMLIASGVAALTVAIGIGAAAVLVLAGHDVARRALAPVGIGTPAGALVEPPAPVPATAAVVKRADGEPSETAVDRPASEPPSTRALAPPAFGAPSGGLVEPPAPVPSNAAVDGTRTGEASSATEVAAAPAPGPSPVPRKAPVAHRSAPATALAPARRAPEAAPPVDRAWNAFHRNALTTPAQDNAVKWAEMALAADPRDPDASEVLRAVIDRYLGWSSNNLERNRLNAASRYLARAQQLDGHATTAQSAAMKVLDERLAQRRSRAVGGYHIDAPQWLDDLDAWLRDLPLPKG